MCIYRFSGVIAKSDSPIIIDDIISWSVYLPACLVRALYDTIQYDRRD